MNRINRILPLFAGDPWSVMAAVGEQFLRDFEGFADEAMSPVRLAKSDNALLIEVEAPGRNVEDMNVSLEGRLLEVQASAPVRDEEKFVRAERPNQPLAFKWKLPFEPEANMTQVNYENGILKIVVQQAPAAARQKLEIHSN